LVQAADTYCGDWDWPPTSQGSAPPLTSGVSQITRPALGRQRVFPVNPFGPAVTADGLCAAYTKALPAADGGTGVDSYAVEVWDLQTDRTIDLLVVPASDSLMQAKWVEAEPPAGR
jgi:hypothetical protein